MHFLKSKIEFTILIILVTIYVTGASLVSLNRYWQYNAFWYDFGILDETIWKLSRFQNPLIEQLNPPTGLTVWGDHFNPSIILYAPFYWITDRAEIMLVVQAAAVGISAVIAYLLAKKVTGSILVSAALTTSYLGFTGMQNALFTDIHNIVFSLPFLMLSFWSVFTKKWKLYFLFLLITLGFQENLAGLGTTLGLYLILRKDKNVKYGFYTIMISVIWAAFSAKLIMPLFLGAGYKYSPALPPIWYQWITFFFTPPIKLQTIILTFITFGILPLFSLPAVPMIIEHFLERFVLNTAATRWDLGFHYNALLSPIMLIAALEVLINLKNSKLWKKLFPYWSVSLLLTVLFLHRFYLHGPLMLATHPVFYRDTRGAKFMDDFVKKIPRSGLLMTQNNIAAHFTHGKVILMNADYDNIKPDYIAVDTRQGQNANDFFPLSPAKFDLLMASISADPKYRLVNVTDSQLIFIRK